MSKTDFHKKLIRFDKSQNTFVYQPTLDTLKSKKYKDTDYALGWKWKGVYNSKLKTLCKDLLFGEQNSCTGKILIVYMVYDLDALSRNCTDRFKLLN